MLKDSKTSETEDSKVDLIHYNNATSYSSQDYNNSNNGIKLNEKSFKRLNKKIKLPTQLAKVTINSKEMSAKEKMSLKEEFFHFSEVIMIKFFFLSHLIKGKLNVLKDYYTPIIVSFILYNMFCLYQGLIYL